MFVESSHVAMKVESPSVVKETVEKEKLCPMVNTSDLDRTHHFLRRKILRLVMPLNVAYPVVANYIKNTWDAMLENGPWFIRNNPLILKKWHSDKNLLKEDVSTILVWVKLHGVPVTAFNDYGLSAIATKLGTPLMLDSYTSDMWMQSWGREGHYTCNVCVKYEWKPPKCSSCKVFGHIHEECSKNTGSEYRPISKKPNASSSGNKKKSMEPTIEVSNSNPFDVLNSIDNDVEFGTNGGTTNLVNNGATSSGSSFMNVNNDEEFASNTPIGEKIDKTERQICEGKLRLLDNERIPLVPTGIVESNSEVEVVFDETANLRISTSGKDGSDKGYGTNSLLEQ
nr:hypothetical protein [Tanacetum cinerariifolium]